MLRQSAAAAICLLFYLCPLSQSTAQGVSRQCYEVNNETVCYFRPADGVAMNWDDADKFCRDNNATLPVIPNNDHQRTIEMYFTQILTPKNVVVFTAGRKSWSLDPNYPWRWVNGKQARTPVFKDYNGETFGCIDPDLIIISNGIRSWSSYPAPFICQYSESICKMLKDAAYLLDGRSHCFVIYGDRLSWYEARNKCIEGGGDLAIFDDVDSFMAFHNFTSSMKKHFLLLIGLQTNWWTWRARATKVEVHDENLKERNNSNPQTDKFSNSSRCFDINGTQVCYFTPENATRLNFASASQWCRDHNATLPIIRNKIYQKSLESFLKTISQPIYLLWTSGLRVKTGVWSWINGHPFRESYIGDYQQFVSFDLRTLSQETLEKKGRLLRFISYDKKPKPNNTGYICQFQGDSCNAFSNGIRSKSDECLMVNEEQVSWYKARNRCINDGGDLATFEDVSKIEKLESLLTSDKSYHIGLENSRWAWNQSDELEDWVQYTNWNGTFTECLINAGEDEDDFKCFRNWRRYGASQVMRALETHCSCIETFTYKWIPCDCDLTLRFVCQRVESNNVFQSSFQLNKTAAQNVMCSGEGNQGLIMIAGVQGLIIAVLVIVIISLATRFRKKSKTFVNSALEMQATTDEGYISVDPTIDSNPSEYQDLKLYEEVR